jgi:hypothetical protein
MILKFKVKYRGLNKTFDKKLTKTLTEAGFQWYAQGFNLEDGQREICFEYEEEKVNVPIPE